MTGHIIDMSSSISNITRYPSSNHRLVPKLTEIPGLKRPSTNKKADLRLYDGVRLRNENLISWSLRATGRGVFKSNFANMSDAHLRGTARNFPFPGQANYNKRLRRRRRKQGGNGKREGEGRYHSQNQTKSPGSNIPHPTFHIANNNKNNQN